MSGKAKGEGMRARGHFLLTLIVSASALVLILAGCNAVKVEQTPVQETIDFSLDGLSDATFDVTVTVTDTATAAVLFNQTNTRQVVPFSASYTLTPKPVTASMSVKFDSFVGTALHSGTNTGTGGPTLTDASGGFTSYTLPLFVADDPTNPAHVAIVLSISNATTLALATSFPTGSYYLFHSTVVANGTNTTPNTTTVTDGSANFTGLVLPLFVADNPVRPAVLSDVQSIPLPPPAPTTMTVSPAFAPAIYYVLPRGQLSGQITSTTGGGTDTQPCYFSDDTLATSAFSAAF